VPGAACGPLGGAACGPLGGAACGPLGGAACGPLGGAGRGAVDGEGGRPPGGAFGGGSGALEAAGASFGGGIPASVDDACGLGFCPGPSPSDDDMERILRHLGPAQPSLGGPGPDEEAAIRA
jgi:hypothetical protein